MEPESTQSNPFAPPSADIAYRPTDSTVAEEEAIRRSYLKREHSIKSVGLLFIIFSVTLALIVVSMITSISMSPPASDFRFVAIVASMLFGCLVVGQFFAGIGIRRLQPWGRIAGIVFSSLWLIYFPIGTVLSLVFLLSLLGPKNRYVFSPEYERIIRLTPYVKYRSSLLMWVLLAVVFGILLTIALSFAFV